MSAALAVEARCQTWRDWRCRKCGVLLARVIIAPGSCVEIVCRRCSTLNVMEASGHDTRATG